MWPQMPVYYPWCGNNQIPSICSCNWHQAVAQSTSCRTPSTSRQDSQCRKCKWTGTRHPLPAVWYWPRRTSRTRTWSCCWTRVPSLRRSSKRCSQGYLQLCDAQHGSSGRKARTCLRSFSEYLRFEADLYHQGTERHVYFEVLFCMRSNPQAQGKWPQCRGRLSRAEMPPHHTNSGMGDWLTVGSGLSES